MPFGNPVCYFPWLSIAMWNYPAMNFSIFFWMGCTFIFPSHCWRDFTGVLEKKNYYKSYYFGWPCDFNLFRDSSQMLSNKLHDHENLGMNGHMEYALWLRTYAIVKRSHGYEPLGIQIVLQLNTWKSEISSCRISYYTSVLQRKRTTDFNPSFQYPHPFSKKTVLPNYTKHTFWYSTTACWKILWEWRFLCNDS